MATQHRDIEFHVGDECFDEFPRAAAAALIRAIGLGSARVDVVIHSEAGARHHGGDDAVAQYREDSEASVFERFEITVNCLGRIP